MKNRLASLAAVALLGAAACGKPAAPSDDLAKDLALAAGSSVELAPHSTGTQVVSDLEQGPEAAPKRAPSTKAPVARPTPKAAPRPTPVVAQRAPERPAPAVEQPAPTPAPVVVAAAPAPEPEPVIATPRPMPAPRGTPERRGGYSSVSDVIRRAPFPVTPMRGVGTR